MNNQKLNHRWWNGGVIYQVYPRSFLDTGAGNNGTGDLNGITARLEYIAALGADAVWISPFFQSPMKDFGYDVSDYRAVHPMFGTMDDFKRLLAAAHDLGLKVMIDLVVSHTSDRHPWFAESRAGKNNPKADWYVWADAKPDGAPPNNWLSVFGGTAWKWDGRRCQYYMHNFLDSQPDLNFHNSEVQDAILDVAEFWLALGVDGFRLDTINFYFHDRRLRDNPPLPEELRSATIAPAVNPYNFQDHIHDRNQSENIAFLERLRRLMDQYPDRAALGEVGDAIHGLEIIADYTRGEKRAHLCYSFEFLAERKLSAAGIRRVISGLGEIADDTSPCWAFSNHDVMRHATRLLKDGAPPPRQAKFLAALLLSFSGSVCIYQGEELGLPEAEFDDVSALRDPYGIEFWPRYKGRDGCRTPMVWNADAPNGGFSSATPWLPVDARHLPLAVDRQEADADSVLHFYRRIIALRKNEPALRNGSLNFCDDSDGGGVAVAFHRGYEGREVLCVFNPEGEATTFKLPPGEVVPIDAPDFSVKMSGDTLALPPFSAFWAEHRR
ncbi:MAG: alpha-amylase family glycosyl hydrolase [Alphaproteobacteria bacterium]|nr:alpha-amylase family glycosyl hydrolase [Alphaproteobacteria bacterium]